MAMKPNLNAKWTDDCQGKKDFDGDILSISTRYWPRGGGIGFLTQKNDHIEISHNENQNIKPSAKSSLVLWISEDKSIDLISQEFEADTEQEVKEAVEKWARQQFGDILGLLRTKYSF